MTLKETPHIGPHALSCLRLFGELLARVQDPTCQLRDQLRPQDVQDALGRFKVWGGNLGAFISSSQSRRSLQHRLREASQIKDQVIKLLSRLSSSLERALAIVAGLAPNRIIEPLKIDDSCSDDDESLSENGLVASGLDDEVRYEIQDLFLAAENTIGNLLRLSIIIHKPIPKDRYARLASLDPIDERYDQNHIWEKCPSARSLPWLIERVGKANAKRRQYFLYRERHREKLSQGAAEDVRPIPDKASLPKSTRDVPARDLDTEFHSQPSGQRSRDTFPSTNATTLILKANSTINLSVTEGDSDNGQSMTSFATSVGEGSDQNVQFPPQPEASLNGKEFECPYCWTIVTVRNRQAWKKHVIRDLQPYVCTSEACALRIFPSRAEWFEHELQAHRKIWSCLFCDREHKTPEQLLRHMQNKHGEMVTNAQEASVLRSSERPVQKISPSACPFCNDWKVSSNDTAHPNNDIVVTPAQFRRHLGRHLEQIALFTLPRRQDEDDVGEANDLDSNQALDDSSEDGSYQLENEDAEEVDLSKLRLIDVQGRISLIRSRKRKALMDTLASADPRLLDQLQVLWEQALARRTARHGPDHSHSTDLIEDLAMLYQVQGKWDSLVRLRRENLRRVSKDENASVSQVTMNYDRTTAFVLLMKAYRDQGATVALDSLRLNLMRQVHVSRNYPTICNTAYVLLDHGFHSEARELCTSAKEMRESSVYVPELCVLAQLLFRADMDEEAKQIGYHIHTVLTRKDIAPEDESIEQVLALAGTFHRREMGVIGTFLRVAALKVSSERFQLASARDLAAGPLQKSRVSQETHRDRELLSRESLHAALVTAAERGDLDGVKEIMSFGADVSTTPASGMAALCAAIPGGHVDVVTFLLENGAKPLDDSRDGPLDQAVKAGSEPIVRILLDYGVDMPHGHAVRTAVELDAKSIVKILLDHSLSSNGAPLEHAVMPTLLVASVANNLLEMTALLIERGFPPKWCPTALYVAASSGFYDLASLLLTNGAIVRHRDHLGYTAICHAALAGRSRIIDLLLSYDRAGYLAIEGLIAAASVGEEDAFNVLWRHCRPADVKRFGNGAIVAAAKIGHAGIMRSLLQQRHIFKLYPGEEVSETTGTPTIKHPDYSHAGIRPPTFNGVEAGQWYTIADARAVACSHGQIEIVKLLMEDGSSRPSDEDVCAAIWGQQTQMVLHLLSVGCEMTSEILHLALREGDSQTCQVLLEKVTLGNKHKMHLEKCLDIASNRGDLILVDHILQKAKEMGITEQLDIPLALCTAIDTNRISMAMHLIESKESFSVEDLLVQRSLLIAVTMGLTNVVESLLSKGVEMDFERRSCYKLLYEAHKNWYPAMIEALLRSGKASFNSQVSSLECAMRTALSHGHEDLYQYLLARKDRNLSKDDADRQNAYTWLKVFGPAQKALPHNETELLGLLDVEGVSDHIQELNQTRHAILWSALKTAPLEVTLQLISLGADVNIEGQQGKRPLHIAASKGYASIIEALLGNGADPNIEDDKEMTPLDCAVVVKSMSVLKCLIIFGAVVDLRTMAMVIDKFNVFVLPLSQLMRGWGLRPDFSDIQSRLQDRAEVKVELLRCILQLHFAEWVIADKNYEATSADDYPSGEYEFNEAIEAKYSREIYEQWLSIGDESGDNPFRKTLNRLLNEEAKRAGRAYTLPLQDLKDSLELEGRASALHDQTNLSTEREENMKPYKLLVLRREIRFAKAELSKKQAELKTSLAHKRRLDRDLAKGERVSSPSR